MGGPVKRFHVVPAALVLALAAAMLAGSCTNPLNDTLWIWGQLEMVKVPGGTLELGQNASGWPDGLELPFLGRNMSH